MKPWIMPFFGHILLLTKLLRLYEGCVTAGFPAEAMDYALFWASSQGKCALYILYRGGGRHNNIYIIYTGEAMQP